MHVTGDCNTNDAVGGGSYGPGKNPASHVHAKNGAVLEKFGWKHERNRSTKAGRERSDYSHGSRRNQGQVSVSKSGNWTHRESDRPLIHHGSGHVALGAHLSDFHKGQQSLF